jgi:NADH-quinone oxidoreductase subunit M
VLAGDLPPLSAAEPAPAATDGATATTTVAAPATAPVRRALDLSGRELAVVTPLIALIIALGFYPQPLLNIIEPAVAATMSDVGSDPGGIEPAATDSSEGTD